MEGVKRTLLYSKSLVDPFIARGADKKTGSLSLEAITNRMKIVLYTKLYGEYLTDDRGSREEHFYVPKIL